MQFQDYKTAHKFIRIKNIIVVRMLKKTMRISVGKGLLPKERLSLWKGAPCPPVPRSTGLSAVLLNRQILTYNGEFSTSSIFSITPR